jgi:iron complex outermembrane recepter protein
MKIIYFSLLLSVLFFCILYSVSSKDMDSLKTYRLGEIVRTASGIENLEMTSSVNSLQYYEIQNKDAFSVSELGKYIPSVMTQTNSRGETMLFLRGAGERQLGLFFDGVLLNVPWDNRMDLSVLPADIVGDIHVNKGSSSILYGPNVLGGAVNISTIERKNDGFGAVLRLQGNDANSQLLSLTHDARIGKLNYLLNASYENSDGFLLSSDDYNNLDNQNLNSKLRTNTDAERYSVYLRSEYKFSDETTIGLSFNHINAKKGVAPLTEGSPSDIRYWRYPEWKRTIITLNGEQKIKDNFNFRAVFWSDLFGQTIDSYTGLDYKEIEENQIDEDLTMGTRLTLDYNLAENHSLVYVFNAFMSDHNETIKADDEEKSSFEQKTMSTGLEYRGIFGNLIFSTGGAYDYNENPETGIFTDYKGISSSNPAFFAGLRYNLTDNLALYANTSRRSRFPTMRESFSGALNKFKVNPDLKPETGLINELGLEYRNKDLFVEITPFASFYDNLIQKIKLSKDEDPQQRSMRVNFAEAFIGGVEMQFSYMPLNSLFINGFLTYMYSEGENEGKKIEHLEYQPELSGFFHTGYKFDFGLTPTLELEYTGSQWGLDADGDYDELSPYVLLNIRISYKFIINDILSEFFVRCNNVLDEAYVSKIGLPNPGRMFNIGLTTRL